MSDTPASLVSRIRPYREPSQHGTLLKIVRAFLRSEDFLGVESRFDPRLLQFHASLVRAPDGQFGMTARSAFERSFGTDPRSFATDALFVTVRARVSDSIVAAAIDPSVSVQARSLLSIAATACAIVEALAAEHRVSASDFRFPVIVFPKDLFPLPSAGADLADHRRQQAHQRVRDAASSRARAKKLAEDLASRRRAIDELVATVTRRSTVLHVERKQTRTGAWLTTLMFQVQEQQFQYSEPWEDQVRIALRLDPAAKVPVSVNALRFYNYEVLVTVFCVLEQGTYEKWQLDTFFAIKRSYEAAKARYDNAVAAEKVRNSYEPSFGRNPVENRYIEQTELKRACISLLTGQRFDLFDAMNPGVAPYGYPEIDFIEAKAEGKYIRLLEQAFEWNNMTYVFYPYFWSGKAQWTTLAQLADNDAMFNRFLQAGAARVQVPVRLGFDATILNYLAGFGIWDADGNLVSSDGDQPDPAQLSLVDELRSQLGDSSVPGPGTVAVTNASRVVIGTETTFAGNDEHRRINLGGKIYVIEAVDDTQHIRLSEPYGGDSADKLSYTLGAKLVGPSWEVRLPTNLIRLDNYIFS